MRRRDSKKTKKIFINKKINTYMEDIFGYNRDKWDSYNNDYKQKVKIGRWIFFIIAIIFFVWYMSIDSELQPFYKTLPRGK